MLSNLNLHNFKSAKDLDLPLENLTVLSGLNGSGKSTVLQAIALLKQSLRSNSPTQEISLRGPLVNLGRSEDVRFENAESDVIAFSLTTPNGIIEIEAPAIPGRDTLPARVTGDVEDLILQLNSGFQMIQADRITPFAHFEQASTGQQAAGWLGCRGEFAIDYLLRHQTDKVSAGRLFPYDDTSVSRELLDQVAPTDNLLDQVSGWLQHLSPGIRPHAIAIDLADAVSLRFSYTGISVDSTSRNHRPANVGFGLTYVLPIIIACLAAPAGSILLLENPEAHLHPRGQSALGKLLALCAADGVQIVVETHSDHVINGIRVAVKRRNVEAKTVRMHFFTRDIETGVSSVASPVLDDKGRFSDWPDGFFDEWDRALDELVT